MMTINLVCVGNLKEKYWIEACDEYRKRLSKFCKLKLVEVDEQNKYTNIDQIVSKEGEIILNHLTPHSVLMAIEGKQYSSEELADFIREKQLLTSELTFVIGGSYGVSDEVKKSVQSKISFGKPTFPHNLARVMLLEQIYRAFMINAGSSYHK